VVKFLLLVYCGQAVNIGKSRQHCESKVHIELKKKSTVTETSPKHRISTKVPKFLQHINLIDLLSLERVRNGANVPWSHSVMGDPSSYFSQDTPGLRSFTKGI
jgi:hypothetical protein